MAFAVSTVVSVAGLALSAGSLYMGYENSRNAARAQSAAAQNQAEIGRLQAANVDVQKQQLDLQTQQQQLQIQTQKNVISDQAQADKIRIQAAELDATRKQREQIRQGVVAASQNLVNATAGGATQPGSTALSQSRANVSGQTNTNILGITQNLSAAEQLYNINKDITSQYLSAQDANSTYVAKSQALQSQVLNTQKQIYSLGGDASSNYAQAAISQGNASMWGGLSSIGSMLVNNSQTIGRVASSFGGLFNNNNSNSFLNNQPTDI